MSDFMGEGRKEMLKELLFKVHKGASLEELKEKFGEDLGKEEPIAPLGHPLNILMEEHKMLLRFAGMLEGIARGEGDLEKLKDVIEHLKEGEKHFLREEYVLFPYLEKHGITEPPAIMWMEHDGMREIAKALFSLEAVEGRENIVEKLDEIARELTDALSTHIYKENHILFPTALKVIEGSEWREIRSDFDEIGYCCFTPPPATFEFSFPEKKKQTATGGQISLGTGSLTPEEMEAMLNTLPLDITFVDKDDIIRYFNRGKVRIFLRTKAILGRKVQRCHPQRSLPVVNRILEEFRRGERDVAEFWLDGEGGIIYIRYFAVRDKEGEYLGCLEVAQDVTELKKIEGERKIP